MKNYTIQELSAITGYPRRTIRFYVQCELIPPPRGRGRGGFYSDTHLQRLLRIKAYQGRGLTLTTIAQYLNEGYEEPYDIPREVWITHRIIPGLEISVRRDIDEAHSKKLRHIISLVSSIMKEEASE